MGDSARGLPFAFGGGEKALSVTSDWYQSSVFYKMNM